MPIAPTSDEAREHNWNLPGDGGVFNYANLAVYHYGGNNPLKYTDPTGEFATLVIRGAIAIGKLIAILAAGGAIVVGGKVVVDKIQENQLWSELELEANGQSGEGASDSENKQKAKSRTPEDLVNDPDSVPNETGRGTRHGDDVSRPGGQEAADQEFGELTGDGPVENHGNGVRSGTTSDGRRVTQYPESSSGGEPTIRVDGPNGRPQIKFRYPQ